jgi:hypothetical protein
MKKGNELVKTRDVTMWVVILRRIMAREGYCQMPMHTIFLLTEMVSMKAW